MSFYLEDPTWPAELILNNLHCQVDRSDIIGKGGFGVIYKGYHNMRNIEIVLKRPRNPSDDEIRRFRREGQTWRRLRHPNILEFMGILILPGDEIYLVSPFMEDGCITDYLRSQPWRDRIDLLLGAAQGLAHMHNLQIVHRDVKGSNLLISSYGDPLWCDFGLSKDIVDESITSEQRQFVGTMRYQSPQIWDGVTSGTFKCDVWSFGMTIYEILSGKIPFHDKPTGPAVISAVLKREERPPFDPAESPLGYSYHTTWALAGTCWIYDPFFRPPMSIVVDDLLAIAAARPEPTMSQPPGDDSPPDSPPADDRQDGSGSQKVDEAHDEADDETSMVQPGTTVTNPAEDLGGELAFGRWGATGAYAEVHEGSWKRPDGVVVPVAIKRLLPMHMAKLRGDEKAKVERNVKRLRRETTIWLRTSHPNILPLLGFRAQEVCLVSPWCKHGNMEQYILDNPSLPSKQRLRHLLQAAEGLNYLHNLSPPICHADVKPSNIIIRDDLDELEAALIDFGLSRVISTLYEHNLWVTSGVGRGTYGYQAMEVLEGAPPSLESDVFGFGGVILMVLLMRFGVDAILITHPEILSGRAPFHRYKLPSPIIMRMIDGKLPTLEEHPGLAANNRMWSVIRQCWSLDPAARPSMAEIIKELNEAIAREE